MEADLNFANKLIVGHGKKLTPKKKELRADLPSSILHSICAFADGTDEDWCKIRQTYFYVDAKGSARGSMKEGLWCGWGCEFVQCLENRVRFHNGLETNGGFIQLPPKDDMDILIKWRNDEQLYGFQKLNKIGYCSMLSEPFTLVLQPKTRKKGFGKPTMPKMQFAARASPGGKSPRKQLAKNASKSFEYEEPKPFYLPFEEVDESSDDKEASKEEVVGYSHFLFWWGERRRTMGGAGCQKRGTGVVVG